MRGRLGDGLKVEDEEGKAGGSSTWEKGKEGAVVNKNCKKGGKVE